MPFTNYLDQQLVQLAFGDVAWAPPATLYVALSTSAPTQAVGTSAVAWNFVELPVANGYGRVACVNNGTEWVVAPSEPVSGYEVQNGVTVAFPLSTGPWVSGNPIGWFGIFDAAVAGNLLAFGAATPTITVPGPGYIPEFAPGELTTSIT